MNFLYYKNFGEEKTVSSTKSFKKKKDKKPRGNHYGNEDIKKKNRTYSDIIDRFSKFNLAPRERHRTDCQCELCTSDYPLRTHLLLGMYHGKQGPSKYANSSQKHSTVTMNMSNLFALCGKSSGSASKNAEEYNKIGETAINDLKSRMQSMKKKDVQKLPIEPVNVSTMKQDCFMIPVRKLKNFFPAGNPIPSCDGDHVRMVEMKEPDLKILFHMIGPATAFMPSLTSPLIDIHKFQKEWIVKAFKSTVAGLNVGTVLQGMVLLNLEKGGELGKVEFPFMIVWIIDTKRCDIKSITEKIKRLSLDYLDAAKTGFISTHYFDHFEEVATLAKPPLDKISRRASTPGTGYIISVFKVFEGDDGANFERKWLAWTGAKALYCNMTADVGLRRLTLHKSAAFKGVHHYILVCDCSNFLMNLCSAVKMVPRLRMRLCGDTGLYRPICTV